MFTGHVWFDVIAQGQPPSRLRVNAVHFSPGAHTAWHRHANGQTLHVTEGLGLVQARAGGLVASEANYRRALAIAEASEGPGSAMAIELSVSLAEVLSRRGRHDEAEARLRDALASIPPGSGR